MSNLLDKMREEILQNFRQNAECENGNHYFVRYDAGNLICKKCGKFAKVGYMRKGGEQN